MKQSPSFNAELQNTMFVEQTISGIRCRCSKFRARLPVHLAGHELLKRKAFTFELLVWPIVRCIEWFYDALN